jgi:hypothetical protein
MRAAVGQEPAAAPVARSAARAPSAPSPTASPPQRAGAVPPSSCASCARPAAGLDARLRTGTTHLTSHVSSVSPGVGGVNASRRSTSMRRANCSFGAGRATRGGPSPRRSSGARGVRFATRIGRRAVA